MAKTEPTAARKRLREWRGQLSLRQAAELVKIDACVLGKIEAGRYQPGEALCWRIQQATGIPASSWPMREKKGKAA